MARFAGLFSNNKRPEIISETSKRMLDMIVTYYTPTAFSFNASNIALAIKGPEYEHTYYEDHEFTILLDGTFYNIDELSSHKNPFSIVIEYYKRDKLDTLFAQLNADCALVIFDKLSNKLVLMRDKIGAKPVYYYHDDKNFGFSSLPASLVLISSVKPDQLLNKNFTARFAGSHYRYIDNILDESPYQSIHQLPASSYLVFENNSVKIHCYWKIESNKKIELSENELVEEYKHLLLKAVNIRVNNTQKQAFTLSGGMDSSSVLALASTILQKKLPAFSTVYNDKTYDESEDIKTILDSTVSKWNTILINDTPDLETEVYNMIAVNQEPVATATWLSHFNLCKSVHQNQFQSLYGGLGGDELNAGEYEYFFYFFADLEKNGNKEKLTHEIKKWQEYHDHPIFKKNPEIVYSFFKEQIDLKSNKMFWDKKRLERYNNVLVGDYAEAIKNFKPLMDQPFKSFLSNRTYQDLTRETIPCCLRAEDRHTSAFGIENVLPFLDHNLINFMFNVAPEYKIRDGVTKHLLRKSMKGILHETTRNRIKKSGWNAPGHLWFTGKGKELLLDLIKSESFKKRNVFNIEQVEKIINEHENIITNNLNKENHMMFLWQLLNTALWFRYTDNTFSN